ncbi:MAG TPA: hypothetical protein VMV73_04260 [Candidatus Dormibacteraeota bacterium]|nr:hypothetical protein [Candidatus Dormibacteraeota bacterium]
MPNDTTLRARIHDALTSTPTPALDLTAVRNRATRIAAATPTRKSRRRFAALALAFAIPAVAFAATPQSLMRATMAHLAELYFGPKVATRFSESNAVAVTAAQVTKVMKEMHGHGSHTIVFVDGKRVTPMPLAQAVTHASRDFHVTLPRQLPADAKPGLATYAGGTLSYAYQLAAGAKLTVSIEKATPRRVKSHRAIVGLTARFSKSGALLKSARINLARFAVGDEVIDFGSTALSVKQLVAIGAAMGGRELVVSKY